MSFAKRPITRFPWCLQSVIFTPLTFPPTEEPGCFPLWFYLKDLVQSDWAHRGTSMQSRSFRALAHITGTDICEDDDDGIKERFESEAKGPRFAKLKNWHNGLSAQILNVTASC
uniref:Uncharacterized protein n=1 Tax=Myripristis murdjan TaxID=586833 RepID=A0A667YXW0_9TELE